MQSDGHGPAGIVNTGGQGGYKRRWSVLRERDCGKMPQVPVKVYRAEEIRRFRLDDENEGLERVMEQIKLMFPNLDIKRVRLTWKDSDGEYVSISSNEELQEALKNLPTVDNVLRLFLMDTEEQSDQTGCQCCEEVEVQQSSVHAGIVCDHCQGEIDGIRYKCLICPDYDLCSDCMDNANHEHSTIRIISPNDKCWMPAFMAAQNAFLAGCGQCDSCCCCEGPESQDTAGSNEKEIQMALKDMLAMGYEDKDGYLTKLLKEKEGNVWAVLDVLQHSSDGL